MSLAYIRVRLFLIIVTQCLCLRFSDAQDFSKYIAADRISLAEFNILFGEPLVVKGELTLSGSGVEKMFRRGENLENGLIPARLKISKILYATPRICENLSLVSFDEVPNSTIELDVFALVYRTGNSQVWSPDWSKQTLSKMVVVSKSSLLGGYYIDSMHQSEEIELIKWLEKRVKLLKEWNAGSEERIARSKPNQNP